MKFRTPIVVVALAGAAALTGCDARDNGVSGNRTPSPPAGTAKPTPPPAADNTAKNERDRTMETKTPMDQDNSQADIDITAKIRSVVVDSSTMSFNAKNCKIITEKGVVTLRGVVDSAEEKSAVEAAAKAVAGVVRVDNQLEVKKPS